MESEAHRWSFFRVDLLRLLRPGRRVSTQMGRLFRLHLPENFVWASSDAALEAVGGPIGYNEYSPEPVQAWAQRYSDSSE